MSERRFTIPVKINGIEAYKQKLEEVQKKIEELEKAIEELNNVDITVKVNS